MLSIAISLLQCTALVHAACFFNFRWSLDWLRSTDFTAIDSRDKKRPEQRIELLANVFDKLNDIVGTPCESCKMSLRVLQESINNEDDQILSSFFYGICRPDAPRGGPIGELFAHMCNSLHLYQSSTANGGFSFLPDFANALSELDTQGIDGEYLCHYMFSNACPRPATPSIDYTQYWVPKPHNVEPKQRSGETFNVLHVSDVHLSANYSEDAPANCLGAMCCDTVARQNPLDSWLTAPKYGHWRCDCPQALLESAADNSVQHNKYRFALFTGDMVDHNPVLISERDTLKEEEITLKALKKSLGSLPVFPVMGNHDSYPYSQEPPASSKYADRTAYNVDLMQHMWSDYGWVEGHASEQVKTTHGAYAIEPVKGLKVITLNSNYWYRWNFYNYVGMEDPDPSGILRFLIAELQDCEQRGIKAWVQAHVPPGGLPDEALPPAAAMLAATFERFSDLITGQFFGHTHLDEFSVLYRHNASKKTEQNAVGVAWVAPSITPYTDLNPGWRYYKVDTNTFEIMDAITVYTDIEPGFGVPWSLTPDLDWQVLYSAREQYGSQLGWPETEPLNGKFWHRVAKELLFNPEFSDDFVKLSYRNSSRAPECSDYDCRAERYCYSTSMTPDQVAHCRKTHRCGQRWKAGRRRIDGGRRSRQKKLNKAIDNMVESFEGFPSFPMPRPNRFNSIEM